MYNKYGRVQVCGRICDGLGLRLCVVDWASGWVCFEFLCKERCGVAYIQSIILFSYLDGKFLVVSLEAAIRLMMVYILGGVKELKRKTCKCSQCVLLHQV